MNNYKILLAMRFLQMHAELIEGNGGLLTVLGRNL